MSNTTVTVTYSNGDTREFTASDELEKLIDEGEMFSISTMHSDMGSEIETQLSKMYAGNPMTAMGNMMMMRHNAQQLDVGDPHKDVIIDVVTACIKLVSDETSSYQSGMTKINGEAVKSPEPLKLVK